ncbi:DUF5947 family protein [Amycolatopsis sp. NBC_01286]|uniref:DUF5947 family protein n=1 Tax=Amycolatopsis sp. NBC_01286 TaxID=2903560 RepID=UPI002E0E25DE|nr:DUF5947 family protein [Amycolatopsis sp. NBC_01286]
MSSRTGFPHRADQPGPVPEQRSAWLEKCELCGTPVASRHGHLVDTGRRGLLCACRACFLLFIESHRGDPRYRAVPDRYLWDPERPVAAIDWAGLGIPAGFAFFLRRGAGVAAFHPGPAGAAESLVTLDLWTELSAGHPLLAAAEPEVEAILFHDAGCGTDCYLVPVDVCYRLVGTVRRYWTGSDGGPRVHERVDELFEEIRERARPLPRA